MKKTTRWMLGLLITSIMTLVSCGNGGGTVSNDPVAVQKKFMGYIIKGNFEKAVDMLANADKASPEEKKKAAELLKAFSNEMSGGVKSYEVIGEAEYNADSTKCSILGRYTCIDGTVKENHNKLIKTDKGWACALF